MFDIGFSEILVIAVVALIVIGPERLPGFARTLGHLFGRMQRYVNDVKADIRREIELDELKKFKQEVENSARSLEQSVTAEAGAVEQELRKIESLANPSPETVNSAASAEIAAGSPNTLPNSADASPSAATKPG